MDNIILFRESYGLEDERRAAEKHFKVVEYRADLSKFAPSLVIPRYSLLPNKKEVYYDVEYYGHRLINSREFFDWIESFDWYYSLREYTPRTWFSLADFRQSGFDGPVVQKGCTNSKKFDRNRSMYAHGWDTVNKVHSDLRRDNLIGYQKIIIREYIPLVSYGDGIGGCPFSNEWRMAFYGKNLIAGGYYWSTAPEEVVSERNSSLDYGYALIYASQIASLIERDWGKVGFVLDMAQTVAGDWILIEVNSLEMSGLSEIHPDDFYSRLKELVNDK